MISTSTAAVIKAVACKGILAAAALAILAVGATAAEIPDPIRAEYEKADEYACKLPARAVQRVNLQGDGTPFYVVDEGKLACKGSPFCGSGGCGLAVYKKTADGYKAILTELVQRHSFRKAGAGTELLLEYKTVGKARYRFENGCAIEIGTRKPPAC
ncbi:MAG: hypothetical protein ACHQAQ_11470 [Hyphomicrobiales bacterium]